MNKKIPEKYDVNDQNSTDPHFYKGLDESVEDSYYDFSQTNPHDIFEPSCEHVGKPPSKRKKREKDKVILSRAELKEKDQNYYENNNSPNLINKKVNLNELMARMNESKKQEKKNNIILSAAAISAVTVFGIILTL